MSIRKTLLLAAVIAAPTASAQVKAPADHRGLYLIGTLGLSQGNDDAASQARATAAVGALTDFKPDSKRYGAGLGVGYRFNEFWGVEGGYIDIGRTETAASGATGTFSSRAKMRGADMAIVGYLPATEDLSVYAKFGGIWARTSYEDSAGASDSSNTLRSFWGLGLQTHFNRNLFGRLEYLRFNNIGSSFSGQNSFNHYLLGLGYMLD